MENREVNIKGIGLDPDAFERLRILQRQLKAKGSKSLIDAQRATDLSNVLSKLDVNAIDRLSKVEAMIQATNLDFAKCKYCGKEFLADMSRYQQHCSGNCRKNEFRKRKQNEDNKE